MRAPMLAVHCTKKPDVGLSERTFPQSSLVYPLRSDLLLMEMKHLHSESWVNCSKWADVARLDNLRISRTYTTSIK